MSRQSDNDNHSNQLNPNHDEYWHSRGEDDRPDDWEDRLTQQDDEDCPCPALASSATVKPA